MFIRMWQEQGTCQMTVRNSCPRILCERTDNERNYHGYGMGLIQAVLEKYSYPYFAEQIDSEFVFFAILG